MPILKQWVRARCSCLCVVCLHVYLFIPDHDIPRGDVHQQVGSHLIQGWYVFSLLPALGGHENRCEVALFVCVCLIERNVDVLALVDCKTLFSLLFKPNSLKSMSP